MNVIVYDACWNISRSETGMTSDIFRLASPSLGEDDESRKVWIRLHFLGAPRRERVLQARRRDRRFGAPAGGNARVACNSVMRQMHSIVA